MNAGLAKMLRQQWAMEDAAAEFNRTEHTYICGTCDCEYEAVPDDGEGLCDRCAKLAK